MALKDVENIVLKYALVNAIKYGGRADKKAVLSKVFGERPDLRPLAREIVKLADKIILQVNSMSLNEQKKLLEEKWPELLEAEKEKKPVEKKLPPLPNVENYKTVRTRFAPNPDFDIHIGNARAAILSYEYARIYKGDFILRFEDTDPKTKTPILEAYDVIRENLKWLGIKWKEEHIQSLRMEKYYEYSRKLIELGGAYVCTCSPQVIRDMRFRGLRCVHSNQTPEEALELWDKMLEGAFGEQEAVLRVKTDPKYPDPSVRDWIAFRIIDTSKYPHPLVGDKYIVWPTYNFACGIDDHLLSITHILRGKEHVVNTIKQRFLYNHFKWRYPEAIHVGRLKLEGFILSKSKIRAGIEKGMYTGWNDIRLATLSALRRRGILPEAIWDLILDVGIKTSEARISVVNLHAMNRKYLEPLANRYMFVRSPVKLKIIGAVETTAVIPMHPSFPERGSRRISLNVEDGEAVVYISRGDAKNLEEGDNFRLMGLFNLRLVRKQENKLTAKVTGLSLKKAHAEKIPIIQWVPLEENTPVEVHRAIGDEIVIERGLGEPSICNLRPDDRVQFFRYGFVRIEEVRKEGVTAIYTHN
ncbi:MAG: glutamate--tRNA ligase [Thermoprotei archaeon]|nr:MAG: glutamate--tRNA ligase [Thermoprotei archaeon]